MLMCCWNPLQLWLCLPSYGLEGVVGHGVVEKCETHTQCGGTARLWPQAPKPTTNIIPGRIDRQALAYTAPLRWTLAYYTSNSPQSFADTRHSNLEADSLAWRNAKS